MQRVELDGDSAEDLRQALEECLRRSPEVRYAQRLQCLLLIAAGHGCREVGLCFGKTSRTLERWVGVYRRLGTAGLREDKKTGRDPVMSVGKLRGIAADLGRDPRSLGYREETWNGHLLARHIRKKLEIDVSERQGQRLFRQLREASREPADATGLLSLVVESEANGFDEIRRTRRIVKNSDESGPSF